MTPHSVRITTQTILSNYIHLLEQLSIAPEESQSDCVSLKHCLWMLKTAYQNVETWPIDKLNRWLGFAQCILVVHKITSAAAEREATRPMFHQAYDSDKIDIPETVGRQ